MPCVVPEAELSCMSVGGASGADHQAELIACELQAACRTFALKRVSIVCGFWREDWSLETTWPAIDVVSVVVAGARSLARASADEFGVYDTAAQTWTLPRRFAPALIIIGGPTRLPSLLLVALLLRGVRRIVFRHGAAWVQQGLSAVLARGVVHSGGVSTLAMINRMDERLAARGQGGRDPGLVQAPRFALRVARDCLERMRPVRRYRGIERDHLERLCRTSANRCGWIRNRVLMFNSALSWGGAERQLVNTIKGLHARGIEPSLLCDNFGEVPASDFFAPGLEALGVEFGPLYAATSPPDWIAGQAWVGELKAQIADLPPPFAMGLWPYVAAILSVRPSVVHAWQDQTNVMAGTAAVVAGVPRVILATRNVSPPHFSYHLPHMRQSYQTLLQCPTVRLLNNSRAGAADYAAWLGVTEDAFSVIHNGLDLTEPDRAVPSEAGSRKYFGIPPDAQVIGSIFRFSPEKDPFLWLRCACRIAERYPGAYFLLVGAGPLEPDIRRYAKRSNISRRLILPGTMRDPGPAFAAMSVFLLTSRFEGLPNVLIEAQAAGVPVVSTRAGGSGETFLEGVTGRLVGTRSPEAIVEEVCRVLSDTVWAARARQQAPTFARKAFALDRMIEETAALYGLAHAGVDGFPRSAVR